MNTETPIYNHFGKFVLRLPQHPLQDLLSVFEKSAQLKEKMNDPSIREAIFLASPVLDREIQKYLDGKIVSEKEAKRIKDSFIKYYTRICSRCTPFGTFATCSYGTIEDETRIINKENIKRCIQFDTFFLSKLVRFVSENPFLRRELLYYSNSSIYTVGDKIRYIEYKHQETRHLHHITSVVRNYYLEKILKKAVNGLRYDDIVKLLTIENIDINDAEEYVDDLIKNQLLQGELELNLKESDILDQIYDFLYNKEIIQPELHAVKTFVAEAKTLFGLIRIEKDPDKVISYYKQILESSRSLAIPFDENHILHIDSELESPYCAEIGTNVINQLNEVINFYTQFFSFYPEGQLKKFSNAFYEKYEEQEIPLLEALDPDIGIGYPPKHGLADTPPFLSTLKLPNKQRVSKYSTVDMVLLKKLLDMMKNGENEIVFDDVNINNQTHVKNEYNVLLCMFKLLRQGNSDIIVEPQISASPTRIIGRFSHMNKDMEDLARSIALKEQEYEKNAVYAEVKHVCSTRMGNITNITHIWDYEILLLSGSKISNENKIPVSDLMLSRKNGGLVLRSKRLNRFIIPVYSNAYNPDLDTQPVYKFLFDMQFQHRIMGFRFEWGNLHNVLDYLPRVRYKKCILSVASWILREADIKEICITQDGVNAVRKRRNIPRYVFLADGDNTLFVDFESKDSAEAFVSTIKNRKEIILKETLSDISEREDFSTINECVVPLYKEIRGGK